MTDPIAAFLEARLREDEEAARDASSRSADWFAEDPGETRWGDEPRDRAIIAGGKPIVTEDNDYSRGMVVDHIARHDPSRVLADVAAKRAILAEHRPYQEDPHAVPVIEDGIEWGVSLLCDACAGRKPNWPCRTIRLLASGYRDHPDFDPKWT